MKDQWEPTEQQGITINQLLGYVKRMKEGWGGDTVIKNLVICGKAYYLKGCLGIKVNKYGRGANREHDAEILY